jgi:hypothetical protein
VSNHHNRLALAAMLFLVSIPRIVTADPPTLPTAHAHNDYAHGRPLLDALEQGFCSVEADVFVVDGELWVAHDRSELRPERTLKRLYLEPLRRRVAQHGGHVHRKGPTVTLLIDFKSEAEPTYTALMEVLRDYESMLTRRHEGESVEGAVEVVISGNRPLRQVAQQHQSGGCLVGIDGRLSDLNDSTPRPWMPMISDRWTAHFQWNGEGPMPEEEKARLDDLVKRTHAQGSRLRFWATPDRPAAWRALRQAGVDLINTDDLTGLATFLRMPPMPDER